MVVAGANSRAKDEEGFLHFMVAVPQEREKTKKLANTDGRLLPRR
jgi:hypothetical protein